MKKVWLLIGRVMFWAVWPALALYTRHTERSRILLRSGNEVLVVKNWLAGDAKWGLPGGGLHRGEEPPQAVIRELMEETGVTLDPRAIKSGGVHLYQAHGLRFRYHLFTATIPAPIQPMPQYPEIVETRWVPMRELTAATAANDALTALEA